MNVIKRNGTVVPFDKNKIITAINKALIEVDGQLYETDTAKDIAQEIKNIAKNDSNAQQRSSEAIEIAEKYGVSKKNLEITEKKIQKILNKFTNNN